ncbi:tRNA-splicing endonuclease subunit sen54 [Xylographa bjoerkii]|nr:tRNA-splicing endonuclease subunit sen54 [Xylographa bjoerkii]
MADLDEDAIPSAAPHLGDGDLTDETQDFRFLSNLSLTTEQPSLPRRGEKDFETHGTTSQQDALSKSRAAMHDALSYPRIHNPKSQIIAFYNPQDGRTAVDNPKGQHFRTMGKAEADGRLYLLPEEALYLVERGNLDLRWPIVDDDPEGMPLSLQSAYAVLIGRLGLTLERYSVYTGLKRSGYAVHRSPAWYPDDWDANRVKDLVAPPAEPRSVFGWLYTLLHSQKNAPPLPFGPLVRPGLYRSYKEIYLSLNIIPFHDPTAQNQHNVVPTSANTGEQKKTTNSVVTIEDDMSHLRCSFYVWKPRPVFKKSSPGPPDFRIAVVNAREDNVPILSQLDDLLSSVPYDPPPSTMETQLYQKLKHGWRNVILAIVDQGVASGTNGCMNGSLGAEGVKGAVAEDVAEEEDRELDLKEVDDAYRKTSFSSIPNMWPEHPFLYGRNEDLQERALTRVRIKPEDFLND